MTVAKLYNPMTTAIVRWNANPGIKNHFQYFFGASKAANKRNSRTMVPHVGTTTNGVSNKGNKMFPNPSLYCKIPTLAETTSPYSACR